LFKDSLSTKHAPKKKSITRLLFKLISRFGIGAKGKDEVFGVVGCFRGVELLG